MATLHRCWLLPLFGIPALCAAAGLNLSRGAPGIAAAEASISFGGFRFSWPEDAQALYLRLQRFVDGVCLWGNIIGLVEHAACRNFLSAALEETVREMTASALPKRSPR